MLHKNVVQKTNLSNGKVKVRYNWDVIRLEYQGGYVTTDPITGIKTHYYPTHKDLAAKYGCNLQNLQRKSSEEKWGESRKFFQSKFREKATEDQVRSLVSDSAMYDAQTVDRIQKIGKLVDAHLNRMDAVINDDDGSPPSFENLDEGVEPISVKALSELVNLIDKSQALMRKTVGEPVTNDNQFKQFVDDLNQATRNGLTNEAETEQKIEALNKRKESYTKSSASLEEEIKLLKQSLTPD
jgi:hypothetical protein